MNINKNRTFLLEIPNLKLLILGIKKLQLKKQFNPNTHIKSRNNLKLFGLNNQNRKKKTQNSDI